MVNENADNIEDNSSINSRDNNLKSKKSIVILGMLENLKIMKKFLKQHPMY